ncbi:single-stranded DNA-binding protein [Frankia sp. AgB1.9]|uniref:single-stranded DNA-binding protein n=1 Tax=unclassified Frankia TaxID=2632575 RepID=UPI0019346AAA|nr:MULTISPECIES: single-stranded DNA-binding protein [unclassified Frankia]MBL7490686.1 single-stranded DNA-binding protein [Frankia sp. AgW1.1]MBL7547500.1 single-stranded DNA-binding protein [Frankia sp. AgB1.9]MBL7619011.1 single-stranded DNA-binding protein [Frankia sp. AgB1.8]
MAGETVITVVGNLTSDPELRFTPNGAAVASFTIASTPRTLDRATNEWKDGEALFLRCSIWRQAAEHVAESLQKGARVIVQGRLKQRTFETREGEKRTVIELDVDEIGPSLRYATAKVVRAARGGGPGGGGGFDGGGYSGGGPSGGAGGASSGGAGGGGGTGGGYRGGAQGGSSSGGGYSGGAVDDPWSQSAGGYSDEPPF